MIAIYIIIFFVICFVLIYIFNTCIIKLIDKYKIEPFDQQYNITTCKPLCDLTNNKLFDNKLYSNIAISVPPIHNTEGINYKFYVDNIHNYHNQSYNELTGKTFGCYCIPKNKFLYDGIYIPEYKKLNGYETLNWKLSSKDSNIIADHLCSNNIIQIDKPLPNIIQPPDCPGTPLFIKECCEGEDDELKCFENKY